MQFQKTDTDIMILQNEIAVPITSAKVISPRTIIGDSVIIDTQTIMPWVLLELSIQYYYFRSFGANHPICRMIYLSDSELQQAGAYIVRCFKHTTFYEVETPLSQHTMWQIKVKGISEIGIQIIKQLPQNNLLNTLLHDLYIDGLVDVMLESQGLFECKYEEMESCITSDNSIKQLFASRFLKSIDVSSMSFAALLQHRTIKQILEIKNCSFVFVENYSNSKQIKTLCWK